MNSNPQMVAALAAAERGQRVFPLAPGSKYPALHGENDCPRTGGCEGGHLGWERRATADPGVIRRAWQVAPYNIGLACGPSGLVVVDLDVPKHRRDTPPARWGGQGVTDGRDVLAALCEQHGQSLPQTYEVRTGRGGAHLYFAAPTGVVLRNTCGEKGNGLGWKIDTRAYGGYVVAPGSVVNHRPYTVVNNTDPIRLPAWLLGLLTPKPTPTTVVDASAVRARIRRLGPYVDTAVARETAKIRETGEGGRNDRLFASAAALGRLVASGALPEPDATDALLGAGLKAGLGEAECRRTIANGLARSAGAVGRAA
ncbi:MULTISPECIES: bifunctional DNA primase/polymerase [Streptomyces]|uniref:bifunctional DNA primase/polymerase n=1 Tax=Streptomyces TaxID=1883 RepID=UPI0004C1282D|nr:MULTISPECIES: bifunctional DNA primase/polymerase [Streptomyces]